MFRHAEVFSMEEQDFPRGQAAIQIVDLGHNSDAALNRHRISGDIDAVNARRAARRHHAGGENADGGCLTGAVGAEQAKEFTAPNLE
jgi:hypothetical protein